MWWVHCAGTCEICWLQSWSHYSASNTINQVTWVDLTHMDALLWWPFCVLVYLRKIVNAGDWKTGDLSHSPLRSLPSTQACQRLNWFSIVNLRSVSKENARYLTLLLQRPQSSFELFLAHSKWKRMDHTFTYSWTQELRKVVLFLPKWFHFLCMCLHYKLNCICCSQNHFYRMNC